MDIQITARPSGSSSHQYRLYLMNVARADIRRKKERSIDALRERRYWWDDDPEGRAVIWMSTPEGPKVWMAEHGSPLVPAE